MSSNKTTNYQLHSWEPGDDFIRSEFNENFSALDEAIAGLIVTGTYTGDGASSRSIELGFTPRVVILNDNYGHMGYNTSNGSRYCGGVAVSDGNLITAGSSPKPILTITETGFTVYKTDALVLSNTSDSVYRYVAVR